MCSRIMTWTCDSLGQAWWQDNLPLASVGGFPRGQMSMPRTHAQLRDSARVAEEWVRARAEQGDDIEDLSRIAAAVARLADADQDVVDAVREARRRGRGWTGIARALGTSKQAAIQRYGDLTRS